MKSIRILCLCVLLVGMLVIFLPATVSAQSGSPGEDKLELLADYPKLEISSGQTASFSVRMRWWGSEGRAFDLLATAPKGWTVVCSPIYATDTKISAIRIEPGKTDYPDTVNVVVTPPYEQLPGPGEYVTTLQAVSGTIRESVELKAVVTALYGLDIAPTSDIYSLTATAGKDNYYSVDVWNTGTETVDIITFSSATPEGWTVDFSATGIVSLSAGQVQTLEANIKPPTKAISGDYIITLRAQGEQASTTGIRIRVTVETPTLWGWVGVAIIIVAIAALGFVVVRFSRR